MNVVIRFTPAGPGVDWLSGCCRSFAVLLHIIMHFLICCWYHCGKLTRGWIVVINKDQVHLVQGQVKGEVNGVLQLLPGIVQRVVIAADDVSAFAALKESEPGFASLGSATLQDYEATAARLRAVVRGEDTGWPMLIAPGMQG